MDRVVVIKFIKEAEETCGCSRTGGMATGIDVD